MAVRNPLISVFLVALSPVGCLPGDNSSARADLPDTSSVKSVSSGYPGWGEGDAWTVSSEPILSIGTLDGSEETQLVSVSAAARKTDGSIVVVDRGVNAVRLYDSGGRFVKTLGRGGSGPGEYLDPVSVSIGPGDTVTVWDSRLFRATRFDPSGELVAVETLDLGRVARAVEPPLYPGSVEILADGSFLVRLIEKSGKVQPSGLFRPRSGALRVARDLLSIDTLMFFGDTAKVTVDAPFGRYPIAPPLAEGPTLTHRGNPPRICVGDRAVPEILCLGPDGARRQVGWEPEPAPITDEEVREWREANLRLFGEKLREEDILRMLDQVPIPPVRPAFSGITLDEELNLWVKSGPAQRGDPPSVDYLVFDPDGAFLGAVALPPIQLLEVGADYVMGVYRDELEVESLRLYGLEKPGNVSE
ncbi:MAG: 6-bladed beta-propeller [Longimicrobiales bacterium]